MANWENVRAELHLLAVHVDSLLNILRGRADEAGHQLHEDIDTLVDGAVEQGREVTSTTAAAVDAAASNLITQASVVANAAAESAKK